jgi:hypothetical protein
MKTKKKIPAKSIRSMLLACIMGTLLTPLPMSASVLSDWNDYGSQMESAYQTWVDGLEARYKGQAMNDANSALQSIQGSCESNVSWCRTIALNYYLSNEDDCTNTYRYEGWDATPELTFDNNLGYTWCTDWNAISYNEALAECGDGSCISFYVTE